MPRALRNLRHWTFAALVALCVATSAASKADTNKPQRIKPAVATKDCTSGDCHGSLLRRKVMHGPVAAQQCLDCHKYEDATQHRFNSLIGPNQGCVHCHDMKLKSVVHAPVQHGSCTTCHDPHGSDHPKVLRADPAKDLCLICHRGKDDAAKTFVHTALSGGSCSTCHESHSAEQPQLLKQAAQTL